MMLLLHWIKDQSTLGSVFGIGVPVIAALGGSMVPVEQFPWFIEPISKVLPNRNAMQAFFQIMLDRPDQAIPYMTYLLIFALTTAAIGIYLLNRKGAMTR